MTVVAPISADHVSGRLAPAERLEFYLAIATVALSPMNYLRLDVAYFTAGDFFGTMTLLVMLLNRNVPLRFLGPVTSFWLLSLILFLGGLLIGSVVQGDPLAGLVVFGQYCFSLIVIPVIIASRPLNQTYTMMRVLIYSIAATLLYGAYLIEFVPNANPQFVSGNGRLRSLFERENAAGSMAAIAITFSVYLRLIGMYRMRYFLPTMAVLTYGLLLTGSNTGFGATVLGVGMIIVLAGGLRAILAAAVLSLILFIAIVQFGDLFLPDIFQKRVFGALSSGDLDEAGTFADRFELMKEAIRFSNETVWLGLGVDQYQVLSEHSTPVHNAYLLVLSEGGTMSLLGLFGILVSAIALGIGAYRYPDTRVLGALTIVTVTQFALLLNAFPHFYARFWYVPLALALNLSVPKFAYSTYR